MRRGKLEEQIERMYYHNWSADPYSLGAYSYIGVGGAQAPKQLTRPVESTLLFAGEVTDAENSGTVEGAIASGRRAAQQALKLLA
jgi:monoamine oxidase